MARIPQPREIAELKGSDKKNPQRYRNIVPKQEMPLGNAPDYLASDAQKVWFELEAYALPGVLTGAERVLFEITSNLIAEYRRDPIEFQVGKYGHLITCLGKLGMSPADRQKLGVSKAKEEDNEFSGF